MGHLGRGKDEASYFLKEKSIKLISGGEKATGCLKRKGEMFILERRKTNLS